MHSLLLLAPLVTSVLAQSSARDACPCLDALDALCAKIEANYIGLALDPAAREAYARALEQIEVPDEPATSEACVRRLQELVEAFQDGHLFVAELPHLDASELARLEETAPVLALDEEGVRAALARSKRADPIEGIWGARDGSRYGIIAEEARAGAFVAVTLRTSVPRWRAGHVKARFRRLEDGSYDATLFGDDHLPRHPAVHGRGQEGGAAIRAGVLLHMPPTTWGREFPAARGGELRLDPVDPRAPTFRMLDASTAVFTVPSHSPEYAAGLRRLLEENRDRVREATNLILDLRGDEGGSVGTTACFEFFLGPLREPEATEDGPPVVLSSPDNIAYFRGLTAQGWVPAGLVERLQASPGQVVPFREAGEDPGQPAPSSMEAPARGSWRVGILLDRGVVSAGEAFVRSARRHAAVTLFGEATGGVLDYQNVSMVPFGDPAAGLVLGYPTLAGSGQLPRGGINGSGIPPDVALDPADPDPYGAIVRHLASTKKR